MQTRAGDEILSNRADVKFLLIWPEYGWMDWWESHDNQFLVGRPSRQWDFMET
jgi:hypothetical protein